MKIILADDEKTILKTLSDALEDAGHDVIGVDNGSDALQRVRTIDCDVLITDLRLPGKNGLDIVRALREHQPNAAAMIITGYGSFENALEAMELGVRDFITKPFYNDDIVARLARIQEIRTLSRENVSLKRALTDKYRLERLVGRSPAMQELFDTIAQIAPNNFSVLMTGESGTGKELVAHALHFQSPRKYRPLIPLSCATLPETLLEDELFGHEPGAFTDARKRKIGRFEQAEGGTIFLDDIDDMPPAIQVKLLRILQERAFERLGGMKTIYVDVRVVAATKVDLAERVKDGRFREDLYYRLNVIPLRIPPLRERLEDIPLLVRHFIGLHSPDRDFIVSDETMRALSGYPWRGNIRELENAVKRAIAMAPADATVLDMKHLFAGTAFAGIQTGTAAELSLPSETDTLPLKKVVQLAEAEHIRRALKLTDGNRTKTADRLGISRKNLWEKMKELGIE